VEAATTADPTLLTGDHRAFYNKPTFECGNNMIISLPFSFIENMRVGVPKELPLNWKRQVKTDAMNANLAQIKGMQLWRYQRVMVTETKSSVNPIYEIEYTADVGEAMRRAFVSEHIATEFLKREKWKVDQVTSLCFLRNYRRLVFGEGAKTSRNDRQPSSGRENPWWSKDNHGKLCTEGSVFNMLCHMNLREDAIRFRQFAVLNTVTELKLALNIPAIPKRMLDSRNGVNPIEKSMRILERYFNCRRLGYLNTEKIVSAQSLVDAVRVIKLPMILSVVGKHTYYNHVVVAWREDIIDFEEQFTYSATVENVNQICGPNNPFHKLSHGYIILPSKKMKQGVGDYSDWGENDVLLKYSHLVRK
jgi:hypothetical protein